MALHLKRRGAKVAVGDVSDASHLAAAALNCFSAVFIGAAAGDQRERSFADDPAGVLSAWAEAVDDAGVRRVIWVVSTEPPATNAPESATVDPRLPDEELARRVAALDDAAEL